MKPRTLLWALALVLIIPEPAYAEECEAALDTALLSKWAGMKAALEDGDIPAALEFIAIYQRPAYEKMFTELHTQLSTVGKNLGDIHLVEIRENVAEYELLTTEDGKRISYPVEFIRDTDGVWRLKYF